MRDAYSHCTRLLHQNKQIYIISLPASPIRLLCTYCTRFQGGVQRLQRCDQRQIRAAARVAAAAAALQSVAAFDTLAARCVIIAACHMWHASCKLLSSAWHMVQQIDMFLIC